MSAEPLKEDRQWQTEANKRYDKVKNRGHNERVIHNAGFASGIIYQNNRFRSNVEWFWKEYKFYWNEFMKDRLTHYQFRNKITKLRKEAFADVMEGKE